MAQRLFGLAISDAARAGAFLGSPTVCNWAQSTPRLLRAYRARALHRLTLDLIDNGKTYKATRHSGRR
ncbi:MAG: hypothetical protein J2P54_23470 [Bradyrhizobiaceae bacterium]|nr:hypothetical protein [Bradyrhizobiaceae bacterium]